MITLPFKDLCEEKGLQILQGDINTYNQYNGLRDFT
jgi:hypothetical protein